MNWLSIAFKGLTITCFYNRGKDGELQWVYRSGMCKFLPQRQLSAKSLPKNIILFLRQPQVDGWIVQFVNNVPYFPLFPTIFHKTSVFTASTVGIIKDEVQARIWYPKMNKGWILTRHFHFSYVQFPSQYFYVRWADIIQDETGKEVERRSHGQSQCKAGGSFGIPEKLVRDLMASYPLHTVNYK